MLITREQFNAAYRNLPYPIRAYIADEELGAVVLAVGKTYNLHVDTIGALERETTNMLLGIINPEQFVAELKSAGIPQESISNIVAELNTKIFVPLREKMRNQEPEEAAATAPQVPINQTQKVTPTPSMSIPAVSPIAQQSAAPITPPTPQVAPVPPVSVSQFSPSTMPTPTMPLPQPKIQPQQSQNRDELHAVLKEYGIDPYREPPE